MSVGSPLRVAYLCGEYPRATDTFIQREVAGMRQHGNHVETISVRRPAAGEQGTEEQRAERERTHYLLPCSPWRLVADHASLLVCSPLRYFRGCWMALTIRSPGLRSLLYQVFYFTEAGMAAAWMRRRHLPHLHNHAPEASGYVTMLAAQLGGFTYSLTLHGFGAFSEPSRWRLTDKLEGALFIICVSHHARSQAMLWSNRSCWSRYHIVHCGVDVRRYCARRHAGPGQRILFVGRLDRVKGLPVLLDSLASLVGQDVNARLDLVGDGPERADLEALVREKRLDDHVRFLGYMSSAQLREQYANADIVVLSSFAEGVPVVLMEAMASGLPVVAPHIAGIPELVEDGVSGFLVPSGDANALAAAVDRLLRDPDLRNRFGGSGRAKVEREFDLVREIASLATILQARLSAGEIPDGRVVVVDESPAPAGLVACDPRTRTRTIVSERTSVGNS